MLFLLRQVWPRSLDELTGGVVLHMKPGQAYMDTDEMLWTNTPRGGFPQDRGNSGG